MPYATYHLTYEGFNKAYLASLSTMLATLGDNTKKLIKDIIEVRLAHIIPRSTSKCAMRNFLLHLGHMSMSEMQLVWELAIPYILHDWKELGVAEDFILQGYGQIQGLSRYLVLSFIT